MTDGRPCVFREASGVLRDGGRALRGRTLRVVGAAALGGLALTAVCFLVSWPAFTEMENGAAEARRAQDSYAPDLGVPWLVALCGLPFLLLLALLGSARLQLLHSRAAAPTGTAAARARTVAAVYVLRALCTGVPPTAGFLAYEAIALAAPAAPDPVRAVPGCLALLAAGGVRLGLALAPAAAAEGFAPVAALWRSWLLVRSGLGWRRTAAVALPLGACTLGTFLLTPAAALPLRPAVATAFTALGPDNPYAAHAAARLVPVALAALLTGALALPFAQTCLALLHRRGGQ
ncbi:hypothetical protein [Streptomyces sp. HNM0574]|uniref:hypothetical protein n=1 Tax=Streptomyces sp. HNM0574 TaxID=2714954 RepID=UPI00146C96F7|nr:hypothetical protein [Streptomyces sp. HNM0574]NLU68312.1 hypothetical protein [Streptomyces sp. HNM0574]